MSLSFILSLVMSVTVSLSCDSFIPPELLGCAFNSLLLVNPSSGFVIAEENCGLEVDKEVFFEQPYVFFTDAVSDVKYTMMMVDNDNPLSNDLYLHWLVTDIDGESLKFGLGIYSGNVIAAYVPPDPSQDSCVHRYSIYIFEQQFYPLEFQELPESRADFNLYDFIENVIPDGGICEPVASIKFKSRY